MSFSNEMGDSLIVPGKISIPFSYSAGETASRFLIELRDNKRIMGIRCSSCGRVWAPAQGVCVHCLTKTDDWVELSGQGRLTAYTVMKNPKAHHPRVNPLIYGVIQLDGADNTMIHLIHCEDPESLPSGCRVQAVFAEERTAHILDICHFSPIEDQ